MTRRRAILTDRERELLRDDDAGDQRYVVVSRVRTKIQEELVEDITVLQENHRELYEELREVVCSDPLADDIATTGLSEGAPAPVEENAPPGLEAREDVSNDLGDRETVDVSTLVTTDDVPSSGKEAEARRDAVVGALALLQEYGETDTSSLKDAGWRAYLEAHGVETVEELEEIPLDTYASATEPERSLWNNTVLDVLTDSEHVERQSEAERGGGYRWVDDD